MSTTLSPAAMILAVISSACLPLYAAEAAAGKIDYVAKLNELAKPTGNPKDNAAPFYEKAFELAGSEPNGFTIEELTAWPDDLSKEKRQALTKWWAENTKALSELKQGATKPYWSREYVGNHLWEVLTPNLREARALTYAICARGKLKAARGDFTGAFDDILTATRFGTHIAQHPIIVEQLIGISIRKIAANALLDILARAKLTSVSLAELDKLLADSRYGVLTVIDLRCEEMLAFELADARLYYDESGDLEIDNPFFRLNDSDQPLGDTFKKCSEKDKERVKGQVRNHFIFLQTTYRKAPWEIHPTHAQLFEQEMENMRSNPLMVVVPPYSLAMERSWQSKTYEDAVIAEVALLRYKQQKGRFPENLDELVQAGYLKEAPGDPYAPNTLTYKRKGDDFLLYSWAGDFDDDGGIPSKWGGGEGGGDQVFWPVQKR